MQGSFFMNLKPGSEVHMSTFRTGIGPYNMQYLQVASMILCDQGVREVLTTLVVKQMDLEHETVR